MQESPKSIAQTCLNAAYNGTMSFPEIVRSLMQNGFESYHVDFLRGTATYYRIDGDHVELPLPHKAVSVSEGFDARRIQAAIKEAQEQVAGYTYEGFCEKVIQAGCAGYIVSFPGKRAVYFGRTAETHIEHFPQ